MHLLGTLYLDAVTPERDGRVYVTSTSRLLDGLGRIHLHVVMLPTLCGVCYSLQDVASTTQLKELLTNNGGKMTLVDCYAGAAEHCPTGLLS